MQGQSVLHSPACVRNGAPLLAMLQDWLPEHAWVLEIGSDGSHHAAFFCGQLPGLVWQASELQGSLAMLKAQLLPSIPLDVTQAGQWHHQSFDAVLTANTCHIMPAMALHQLLAGAARVLRPRGLVLLYEPFHEGGRAHRRQQRGLRRPPAQPRSRDGRAGFAGAPGAGHRPRPPAPCRRGVARQQPHPNLPA